MWLASNILNGFKILVICKYRNFELQYFILTVTLLPLLTLQSSPYSCSHSNDDDSHCHEDKEGLSIYLEMFTLVSVNQYIHSCT